MATRLNILISVLTIAGMKAEEQGTTVWDECITPQYLHLGDTGIVECSFQSFYSVFWYNSTDSENENPLASLKDSEKSGDGYLSGQFDIALNGSFLIRNVALHHDHFFRVIMLKNEDGDEYVIKDIRVYVVVKSEQPYPLVNVCGDESFCFAQLTPDSPLSCSVNGSRPAANLTWVTGDTLGDEKLTTDVQLLSHGSLFSAKSTTMTKLEASNTMVLFVCKVLGPSDIIPVTETKVFVENEGKNIVPSKKQTKTVEIGKKLTLVCTVSRKVFIIWKKMSPNGSWTSLFNAYFLEQVYSKAYSNDYQYDSDGDLTVQQVNVDSDGIYSCIYNDGEEETIQMFEVTVFISPSPPSAAIEGCKVDERCVLRVHKEGNLTCKIKGIRPKVELQWFPFPEEDSKYISFSGGETDAIKTGDTYDISITSRYVLKDVTRTSLAVECRVIGWNIAISDLDKIIELQFLEDKTAKSSSPALTVIIILVLVVVLVGIGICVYRNRRKILNMVMIRVEYIQIFRRHNASNDSGDEENSEVDDPDYTALRPLIDQNELFIASLKSRYKDMCMVSPIPGLSDETCWVNNFFVKNSFEVHIQGKKTEERINSHHDIFTRAFPNSLRLILKGDPGFGKRTLCLQMAYEWYQGITHMKFFETYILVDLRGIKACSESIYSAIKTLLLPEYSEETIEILMKNLKGLIILYGYDEFRHGEHTNESDVARIISGDMFSNFHVIVVTTSEKIPKNIDRQARQLIMTTFDENVRREYLQNISRIKNTSKVNVSTKVEKNPFLQELCNIPWFWVLYVHASINANQKLSSAKIVLENMMTMYVDAHAKTGQDKESYEKGDKALAELAFKSLVSGKRQSWCVDDLRFALGNDVINHYEQAGLLVPDYSQIQTPNAKDSSSVDTNELKFCYNVLFDWYAAYHFRNLEGNNVTETLDNMITTNFGNVFCFVCGLRPEYGGYVFKLLKKGGKSTRDLLLKCILESKKIEQRVTFDLHDKLEDQKSALELLEVAADMKEIGIKTLTLEKCMKLTDCSKSHLSIESGLKIPPLQGITLLEIIAKGEIFGNVSPIFDYAASCPALEKVQFVSCLLPDNFQGYEIPAKLRNNKIKVQWATKLGLMKLNATKLSWTNENGGDLDEQTYQEIEKSFHQEDR